MTRFVNGSSAMVSEAMTFAFVSVSVPTTMPPALPIRSPTTVSGSSADSATIAVLPLIRPAALTTDSRRLEPSATPRPTRWARTSESVSDLNSIPLSINSSFNSRKFSMMPLWAMATTPSSEECGWAFFWLTSPWVAQRVCPIPTTPSIPGSRPPVSASARFSRLAL